jgi:hypothetical protein
MYNIVRLSEIASQNNYQYIVVRGEFTHRQEKPSINIHLVNNHWVTSYYNPDTKKVHIYDSLWAAYATRFQSLLKQLQLVYGVLEQDVYQPVQQQGSDPLCGPFAVAFGFTLLLGQNPVGMSFDVGKMRTHLEHVLTAGIIEPFPVKVRDATEAMHRTRRIQFYKTQKTAENTARKRKYKEIGGQGVLRELATNTSPKAERSIGLSRNNTVTSSQGELSIELSRNNTVTSSHRRVLHWVVSE